MSHRDPATAPALVMDTFRHFSDLMQTELRLAKAEVAGKMSRAGNGLALLVLAAILALTALDVLAGALVAYLAAVGLPLGIAALIVGGAVLGLALVLAVIGKSRLSSSALGPTRVLRNLHRDAATVKGVSEE